MSLRLQPDPLSPCYGADHSLGPGVPPSCRCGLDFTLLFQHLFLSALPAAALIVVSSFRLSQLRRRSDIPLSPELGAVKLSIAALLTVAQLILLVLWSLASYRTTASAPSAALNLLAALLLCLLSCWEGKRAVKPSPVLNIYLLGTAFADALQVRTLWLTVKDGGHRDQVRDSLQWIAVVASVGLGLKAVLLVLEGVPKWNRSHVDGQNTGDKEERSPEQKAGVYSLATFWWLNGMMWRGLRHRNLRQEDLFTLDQRLNTQRYSEHLAAAWSKAVKAKKYALLRSVLSTLKWPVLASALPRALLVCFNLAQPLLIQRAVQYVENPDRRDSVGNGLILATAFVYLGLGVSRGCYEYLLYRSITLMRGCLIDVIYRKSLQLDVSGAGPTTASAPVGLVTANVERIDLTLEKVHSIWASTAEVTLVILLMAREVGWACTMSILVALACTVCMAGITKLLPSRQKSWNQAVQRRVATTSILLSNIKTVKMMDHAPAIASMLQAARVSELALSGGFRRCMAVVNTIALLPRQMTAPLTLAVYTMVVQREGRLSVSKAFGMLALVEVMAPPLTILLQTLPSLGASLACFDGIQAYLLAPDQASLDKRLFSSENPAATVLIENASFAYSSDRESRVVLDSMTLTIQRGTVTLILGPIGCGKSALLRAILGEVGLRGGTVHVPPWPIAYCEQSPWLTNGSIRDCIVGADNDDHDWYRQVLHLCALDTDLAQLGDKGSGNIQVGSRGIALSEGQKQRVALARALYSRAPLLLLDDVFRSLDRSTEATICERLFDWVREHGVTLVMTASSPRGLFDFADQVLWLDESGRLTKSDHNDCKALQEQASPPSLQQGRSPPLIKMELKQQPPKSDAVRFSGPAGPARCETTASGGLYAFVSKPVGIPRILVLALALVSLAFLTRFQRIWVQWWTQASDRSRYSAFVGAYFALATGACLSFTLVFWTMFMILTPITAAGLHRQLLHSIVSAPLSYFSLVDAGIILNRFSQDMAVLNGQLPISLFQASSTAIMLLSQLALVGYSSTYMSITLPITLAALWLLARFYLATSRQLRVLDLEAKAPIYSLLTETLDGLVTIRAFHWQPWFLAKCHARVDAAKRAGNLLFMVQRWLGFVLDVLVAALATLVVALATQLRASTTPTALGVGLSSVIGLGQMASQLVLYYTELENSLGAVARIKTCVDTIPSEEGPTAPQPPPAAWPTRGVVEFFDVTAGYNDTIKAVRNVSFRAVPGQTVWIRGRTGSGKSSLLAILLRLIKVHSGHVLIDGLNIANLSPAAVRQRIAVIPQTPFFLPGSVRLNLGLSSTSSHVTEECEMIRVLKDVGLWGHVEPRGGVDATMEALSLTHGQRQLMGVAMALLKMRQSPMVKIVVMDEPTSGVDMETEKSIRLLMRECFIHCTVLNVSHKTETEMTKGDAVLEMSDGMMKDMQYG